MANLQLNDERYNVLVKKYLDDGINYPTAMSKAIFDIMGVKIDKPNDILALSYIKEIIKNKYEITPISIKRTNDYHSENITSSIISANLIRKLLREKKDISSYVPMNVNEYINRDITIDQAYNYLVYNVINNKDKLRDYLTVSEGIENRILNNIYKTDNWSDLVMSIKTKRYTYNKINRMLLHILLNISKDDNDYMTYIRILGFNQVGRKYLNKIKKEIKIPVFTNYKPNGLKVFDIEYRSTLVYAIIVNDFSLIDKEYKNKPIIINK